MKKFIKITLFTIILFLVGIIRVNAQDNISITDVELQEKSEYVEVVEEVSLDNNKITSNVNFYDEGDYVIYKLTIKNNDDKDYKIEDILDDNSSEYLSFEYIYEDGVIKAKSEKEVLLKITYVSLLPYDSVLTPEHTFNATTEVNISFKLTDYVSNPSTLDRIGKQSFTVILCVLLLFAFVKLRKSKILYVLVLGLFLIPIGTNAEREISFNITLKNEIEASVNFLAKDWQSKVDRTFTKIEFVKRATFPDDAVDVSQEQDGTIMAWREDDKIYIGSRYKIFFPADSYRLLGVDYVNQPSISEIIFNDRIDTTFVTYMGWMFYEDSFEEIDLSSFRTGNVTSFCSMFERNSGVKKLDLSNFDTRKVKDVGNLVTDSPLLEEINIDNWDLSSLQYGNSSFIDTKNSLKKISARNFVFPVNSSNLFYAYMGRTVLESIDLTGSDMSHSTDMYYLFKDQNKLKEIKGVENWDTSHVTVMNYCFYNVGAYANGGSLYLDLSNWDISSVREMNYMFYEFGSTSDDVSIIISGWENDLITNAPELFRNVGKNAKNVNITINDVHLSNMGSSDNLFYGIGYYADNVNIDIDGLYLDKLRSTHSIFEEIGRRGGKITISISNVELPSVYDAFHMFGYTGGDAEEMNLSVSNWKFRDLTEANGVFYFTGSSAGTTNFSLHHWEMPNTTSMSEMFYNIGSYGGNTTFKISELDTSALTTTYSMFKNLGRNNQSVTVEGIDTIDFSHVTSLYNMFNWGFGSSTLVDLGTLDIYASDIGEAFNNCKNLKVTLNLHNNITGYSRVFQDAALVEGSEIIVNYTADVTNIDDIINTKSPNSNVIKGELLED